MRTDSSNTQIQEENGFRKMKYFSFKCKTLILNHGFIFQVLNELLQYFLFLKVFFQSVS